MKKKRCEKENELHERIKKMLNEDEKCSMIATMMGMSGVLTSYIVETIPLHTLPVMVHYAMAMTAGNMMAFMHGETKMKMLDLTDAPDLGEQTEEAIYRKSEKVIEMLYKEIQEMKKNV